MDPKIVGAIIILAVIIFAYQSGVHFSNLFRPIVVTSTPIFYPPNYNPLGTTYTTDLPPLFVNRQPVQYYGYYGADHSYPPTYFAPPAAARSPYYQKVRISQFNITYDPNDTEQLTLLGYGGIGQYVDISGWTIQTNSGVFPIPGQGGSYFSLAPNYGDIFVQGGQVVRLHSAYSPSQNQYSAPQVFGFSGRDVYLGYEFADKSTDVIQLLDASGRIVDVYHQYK